ncbi:MAG TPA: hypothetical protein VGV86_08775 [Acidimicrobiales bacterium]|nr:hypothetical protein [Acidimicrobiales bacterium]
MHWRRPLVVDTALALVQPLPLAFRRLAPVPVPVLLGVVTGIQGASTVSDPCCGSPTSGSWPSPTAWDGPSSFWAGITCMAAFAGVGLALLMMPPPIPHSADGPASWAGLA